MTTAQLGRLLRRVTADLRFTALFAVAPTPDSNLKPWEAMWVIMLKLDPSPGSTWETRGAPADVVQAAAEALAKLDERNAAECAALIASERRERRERRASR